MYESHWKIWIDTGGTFTDCIAKSPEGRFYRIKVLSKSALRGKITRILDRRTFYFSAFWNVSEDIFNGFIFSKLGSESELARIQSVDLKKRIIILDHDVLSEKNPAFDFEINSGEEAPVLAARLVTGTSLNDSFPPLEMRLGSTIGTNALLERKGSKTVLVVTKGFKDLLLIGNQQRPHIFSLNIQKPSPFYDRIFEMNERLSSEGKVISGIDPDQLKNLKKEIADYNPGSVAISLLHSYRNPSHEKIILETLSNAGFKYITSGADIAPVINYLNRTETAVVNAYLSPRVHNYLSGVHSKIPHGSLKIMTSAGGLVDHKYYLPKESLFSGPAGGVVGAVNTGMEAGANKIISFDMGGTSTDVARYDTKFDYQYITRIGGATVVSPSLTIETVASGGGSICDFDCIKFTVGPESASASPGPACYGEGGPLTITDVNLLLGRVVGDNFGIPINRSCSDEALGKFIQDGQNKSEILNGFLKIVNEKMANAIRKISVKKGFDPSEYTLISFGGAGGQHAIDLAGILNISSVIIPYDASLLSAAGMGHALIERFSVRQVLKSIESVDRILPELIRELGDEAKKSLLFEKIPEEDIEIREVLMYLRFKGQETSLEIPYDGKDLEEAFKRTYENLYGHWLSNRTIEVESVKVIASEKRKSIEPAADIHDLYAPEPAKFQHSFIGEAWQEVPVFIWEELERGASIRGPALLASDYTTLVVNEDWVTRINEYNQASLHRASGVDFSGSSADQESEAINLELYTNRLTAVAEEMGALLQRTSFSVNIKERLDYSCALLDEQGELIVNAPHIPVHLGGLGLCVREVINKFPLNTGDVIITNHPAFGGSHLPDITMIMAVFDQNGKIVGYVANRAHHAELGGKRPGSMPPDADNLAEEGVIIPPTYLIRKGKQQWDKVKEILSASEYPTRDPEENLADLNGALASVHAGVRSLEALCRKFGSDKIRHYMAELKDYAHSRLVYRLSRLKERRYKASEYLDDGTPIHLEMSIEHDRLTIDFSGSGDLHPGNLNATPAIVRSAVLYTLRLLINENIPLNEGIMRAVGLRLPGGFLNPVFHVDPEKCPAVVGGNTETSQRIVDTLLKALELSACSQGTMNNFLFGDDQFSYYETLCGGCGATSVHPGANAVHQHMTNTRITDPEILEFRYPVRLVNFSIRENSGGKGKNKGGDGVIRQIMFLKSLEITLLSQHRIEAPYGMKGGLEGKKGDQFLIRKNGDKEKLNGIDAAIVQEGDSIVIYTPGGGGWGKDV